MGRGRSETVGSAGGGVNRFGRFLLHHRTLLGLLHRLFHWPRNLEHGCLICGAVWADLLSRKDVVAAIKRGREQIARGDSVPWREVREG